MSGCREAPFADYQWGSDALRTQTATFCQKHGEELWLILNPLLQINKAWFRIDTPGAIKKEKKMTTEVLVPRKLPRLENGKMRYVEGNCRVCGDDGNCWHCKPWGTLRCSRLNNTTIDVYYFDRPPPIHAKKLPDLGWTWAGMETNPVIMDKETGIWFTKEKEVVEKTCASLMIEMPVWETAHCHRVYWRTEVTPEP